jgi:hypothetical protein
VLSLVFSDLDSLLSLNNSSITKGPRTRSGGAVVQIICERVFVYFSSHLMARPGRHRPITKRSKTIGIARLANHWGFGCSPPHPRTATQFVILTGNLSPVFAGRHTTNIFRTP